MCSAPGSARPRAWAYSLELHLRFTRAVEDTSNAGVSQRRHPEHGGSRTRSEREDHTGRRARLRVWLQQAPRLREGRHRAHRPHAPKRSSAASPSTSAAHSPSGWTRRSTSSTRRDISTSRATRSPDSPPPTARSCVVSATAGVEVGTEQMFREAVTRARSGALRRLDDGQGARGLRSASTSRSRQRLTTKVIPVEVPIGEGADFHGIINLFAQEAPTSTSAGTKTGEYEEADIPAEAQDTVRPLLPGADRGDLRDRRHAARALPRGRRDRARRSDPRDEGSDEARWSSSRSSASRPS